MTKYQIKQIVATGDFCIKCPADYDTNEKWREFAEYNTRSIPTIGSYYRRLVPNIGGLCETQYHIHKQITLDEWWDAVHEYDDQPAQWQPQPGEMVEVIGSGISDWEQREYLGTVGEFYLCHAISNGVRVGLPTGYYKHIIRRIQNITITPDQAIQAYAELNKVDAGRVKILES